VGEYASITAAITIFVTSLSGVYATGLTASTTKTAALVSAIARSHHVPTPQARAAYAAAPYSRPALRYLYAVGWVGAASNLATCKAAQVLGPDPSVAAAQAIQGSPKALSLLHSAHITVSQAAAAMGRGSTDGCT
jgi:hypothetical protein